MLDVTIKIVSVAIMSGLAHPVPPDEFVLPIPASSSGEPVETSRESTDARGLRRSFHETSDDSKKAFLGVWRHTIGIILVLVTVVLWTASNFLASVGLARS